MAVTDLESSFANGNSCNWRGCCDSVTADDKVIWKRLSIGSRGSLICDSVHVHTVDKASLENGINIFEENYTFGNKSSASNSVGDVIRLRGGGFNGLGTGSGEGGGLSSNAGAGFNSNGDDPGISSRGIDLYNNPNTSLSTEDDRPFGGENIGSKNRDSESCLETTIGVANSFYEKDGPARTSKNNIYDGDTDEHLANRPEDDSFNLNRKANDYSSNQFHVGCGSRGRYDRSLNIEREAGFSQRVGGRSFGGRGDDHYSQRDGGFGGGGDGGLSIRDNSGFAVRDDAGLGVREYDAFGSKRDGGFDNRDSGCFGAGGDNGLGIRDDGGFSGRGDGGFCNRDDGGFNKRCSDSFNNRSDSHFSNKRVYSNMNNSRKADSPSDNIGSPERNNGGQELDRSFNAVRNSSLKGQYNEYNQENRERSLSYK